MKTDFDLRKDLLEELLWDPLVPDARIAVAVHDGIVTLTGRLDTYAEEIAVRHAAQRVVGVRSIVLDVTIRPPKIHQRTDTEIAAAIEHVLSWSTSVPRENITIEIEDGWVTLAGELDWNSQRQAIERIIRPLKGVIGITDNITLKPAIVSQSVSNRIREALIRQGAREAKHIDVTVDGSVVTLRGQVHSWAEKRATEGATWSAPGVSRINSQLTVGL